MEGWWDRAASTTPWIPPLRPFGPTVGMTDDVGSSLRRSAVRQEANVAAAGAGGHDDLQPLPNIGGQFVEALEVDHRPDLLVLAEVAGEFCGLLVSMV